MIFQKKHRHPNQHGTAFKVHVLGLAFTIQVARADLARVERFALALVEKARAKHPYLY